MVGSSGDRSKEAVGMMALHEALRTLCLNSDWTYSVFWTIRPRPRLRGGNGCKVGDDNGSLMLMWEDGFCVEEIDGGEDPVRKAFSKMSIQLYNYGEGWVLLGRSLYLCILCLLPIHSFFSACFAFLCQNWVFLSISSYRLMGKVASDKCHKWVFKEPTECEPNISNYWQSSFDALPPEWTEQFESGIQTIAVIQAGHGLLQLGSCKIIPEDLHFVLRMRHTFESLGYQSGFYLSQLFSSTRSTSSSTSLPSSKPSSTMPLRAPPPIFNWGQRPSLASSSSMLSSPNNFQHTARLGGFPHQAKDDETHIFLMPPHSEQPARMEDMMGENNENDIKWPNGLSFFNALTGQTDDATKLLFNPESLENTKHHDGSASNPNEFLSLDSQNGRKMDKFKRCFTLPARVASSSSISMDHHQQPPSSMEYTDVMETFLE